MGIPAKFSPGWLAPGQDEPVLEADPGSNIPCDEKRPMERATKLDRWLGLLLHRAWIGGRLLGILPRTRRRPADRATIRKILFIKLWGMGSITLSEPALRWLGEKYPRARIDYLTLRRNRDLFALIPAVGQVHTVSFQSLWKLAGQTLGTILKLRRERYDLIFDGEFLVNFSGLVARAAGGEVWGFDGPNCLKRQLQDVSVPLLSDRHTAAQFLDLVAGPGRSSRPRPRLRLPVQAVDRTLTGTDGKPFYPFGNQYVVLNINASALAIERRWPRRRFLQLAEELMKTYSFQLVLIGSASERSYVDSFERKLVASQRVTNLSGCLSIPDLALLLSRARLLISNDSGPIHVASALDLPLVGFYGPETPVRYGPLSSRRLVFYENLGCSPCMHPENGKSVQCPNSVACMRSIDAARVMEGVRDFVDKHRLLPAWEIESGEERRAWGSAFT